MKKIAIALLPVFLFAACASEPSLDTAKTAAEKYIKSTDPSTSELTVSANPEENAIMVRFDYERYFINAGSGVSQDEIEWWAAMVDIFSDLNKKTKEEMDKTGYLADCMFFIYDVAFPDDTLLYIKNGEVRGNYLDGVVDTYITLEKFNQIQTGMSYQKVCQIIGAPGELMSSVDLDIGSEYATEAYAWYGADGTSNAIVTFQGGGVVSKAQAGLS
ncbi:hypothetical protein LJC49_06690 [Ruminococcaceae bacterium OttesenSCG-928-I18]|nr:hypothetical protein [Ruminococcaceae bacterium OttesenSCG-928-I18]